MFSSGFSNLNLKVKDKGGGLCNKLLLHKTGFVQWSLTFNMKVNFVKDSPITWKCETPGHVGFEC